MGDKNSKHDKKKKKRSQNPSTEHRSRSSRAAVAPENSSLLATGGTSVIHDERRYVITRTDTGPGQVELPAADCEALLARAPAPNPDNMKPSGRRPHLHNDREGHYIDERISLDPFASQETSDTALLNVANLPRLAAYPGRQFDYDQQNSRGRDPAGDGGHIRLVTDMSKNLQGVSFHPLSDPRGMVRADLVGGFVAQNIWPGSVEGVPQTTIEADEASYFSDDTGYETQESAMFYEECEPRISISQPGISQAGISQSYPGPATHNSFSQGSHQSYSYPGHPGFLTQQVLPPPRR